MQKPHISENMHALNQQTQVLVNEQSENQIYVEVIPVTGPFTCSLV